MNRLKIFISILTISCFFMTGCNEVNVSKDKSPKEPPVSIVASATAAPRATKEAEPKAITYIGNKNSKKFHYPHCRSVDIMKEYNKDELTCTREEAIKAGYSPCAICKP